MLHFAHVEALFAVSALVMVVPEAEERVELTACWDFAVFDGAAVKPGHLERVVIYFGRAVEFVEERQLIEVLERRGWIELVVSISVMPLTRDYQIGASAE